MPPPPTPSPPAPPFQGPIRVVLVEVHDMVAEAIGLALDQTADMDVVARASTIAAAVAEVRRHKPDVVVLDRRLPDGDGIAAINELEAVTPGVRVLVLTGEATAAVAARVVEAGGAGLVLKSSRLEDLVAAVLLAGVLDRLTGRVRSTGASLTARERQTLLLLADGASTAEISDRLGVARNTARNHVQRVLTKLGARSKLEAVAIARRDGLLD